MNFDLQFLSAPIFPGEKKHLTSPIDQYYQPVSWVSHYANLINDDTEISSRRNQIVTIDITAKSAAVKFICLSDSKCPVGQR